MLIQVSLTGMGSLKAKASPFSLQNLILKVHYAKVGSCDVHTLENYNTRRLPEF